MEAALALLARHNFHRPWMLGCSVSLTDKFGVVQEASASGTAIGVLFNLPVLLYGLFLLRKVKPRAVNSSAHEQGEE